MTNILSFYIHSSPIFFVGPTGKQLTCNLTPVQSANRRMIEFTPLEVGGHTLSVNFAGQPIKGSPFTCYSYDASRVRIVDITSPAKPNEPLSFTGKICTILIYI